MTDKRPLNEEFDTQMEVERNPCGAWQAIQTQAQQIETLVNKISSIGLQLERAKKAKRKAVDAMESLDRKRHRAEMDYLKIYTENDTLRFKMVRTVDGGSTLVRTI